MLQQVTTAVVRWPGTTVIASGRRNRVATLSRSVHYRYYGGTWWQMYGTDMRSRSGNSAASGGPAVTTFSNAISPDIIRLWVLDVLMLLIGREVRANARWPWMSQSQYVGAATALDRGCVWSRRRQV